jgi:phytoene synthase
VSRIEDQATAALLPEARRVDPDRTLCAVLAPAPARAELLALILLNHELARVAETVRQPLAGLIRHRFWRDQLAAAAAGGAVDHPVPRTLARPLRDGRLALGAALALIEAREAELDGLLEPGAAPPAAPPDAAALEAYLRATSGGLARAMAGLLAAPPSLLEAAEAAGTAFGLVGIVRATALEAGRERRLLARSLVDAAGLAPEALGRPEARARLRALMLELLGRARSLAAASRRAASGAPREQLAPLLLATVAGARLRALVRADLDPLAAGERPPPALLPLRLALAWLLRRP